MVLYYFENQIIFIIKIILASVLGYIIAWDRELHDKVAGLRTFGLISMGACLFTLTSLQFTGTTADPSRIAAGIVTGIGFIGAGIIWQKKDSIIGVTTAAGIWVAAAVGIAVAVNLWLLAIVSAFLTVIIFQSQRLFNRK